MDREQADSCGHRGLWGVEGLSRKEKGLVDMNNSVVECRVRGRVEVEEGIRGINLLRKEKK